MKSNTNDQQVKVYEIGYVLVSSIPEEKVTTEVTSLKDALVKAGASVIAEENAELTPLAYTMTKKIHGSNQRFTEGYFGWVKFELATDAVESVKKTFDTAENVLRYLLIITVKENTYLGKRAPATAPIGREMGIIAPEKAADAVEGVSAEVTPVEEEKVADAVVKGE